MASVRCSTAEPVRIKRRAPVSRAGGSDRGSDVERMNRTILSQFTLEMLRRMHACIRRLCIAIWRGRIRLEPGKSRVHAQTFPSPEVVRIVFSLY